MTFLVPIEKEVTKMGKKGKGITNTITITSTIAVTDYNLLIAQDF